MNFASEITREMASVTQEFGFSGTVLPKRKCSGEVVQSVGFVRQVFSSGVVTVMPVLGVTFATLRSAGEQLGLFDPKFKNPSLNIGLGQLAKPRGNIDYRFEKGGDPKQALEAFRNAFARDGMRFFENTETLDKALAYLSDDFNVDEAASHNMRDIYTFVPLAYLLKGDRELAISTAAGMLSKMTPGRGLEPKYSKFVALMRSGRDLGIR